MSNLTGVEGHATLISGQTATIYLRGGYSSVRWSNAYPPNLAAVDTWGTPLITPGNYTYNITVKVLDDKFLFKNDPLSGDGYEGGFTLHEANTYVFDVSDTTNSGNVLKFSEKPPSFGWNDQLYSLYTTGVSSSGTPGNPSATVTITVASDMPTLYPVCGNHFNMGGNTRFIRGADDGAHSRSFSAPYGRTTYYFAGVDSSDKLQGGIYAVTASTRKGLKDYVLESHDGTGNVTKGLISPYYAASNGDARLLSPLNGSNVGLWSSAKEHVSESVSLGFKFPMGENSYTSASASINGWVLLSGNITQDAGNPMHSPANNAYAGGMSNVLIFPWWTPQKPAGSRTQRAAVNSYGETYVDGGLYFRRESSPERAIFTWITYSHPAHTASDHRLLEYQAVLYPNGQLEYRHEAVSESGSPASADRSSAAKGARLDTTNTTTWTDGSSAEHTGAPDIGEYYDFFSSDGFPQDDAPGTAPTITATEASNWSTNTTYFARDASGGKTVIIPNDTFSLDGLPHSGVSSVDPIFTNWLENPEEQFDVTIEDPAPGGSRSAYTASPVGELNALYNPDGSALGTFRANLVLMFNGASQTTIDIIRGRTYVFDQSASSNKGYPLEFSHGPDGTNNNFTKFYYRVTYFIDDVEVAFSKYKTELNRGTSTSARVRLAVSRLALDKYSTPSELYPFVADKVMCGDGTKFSIAETSPLLPLSSVRPLSVIFVADENFDGERVTENRYSHREWFNKTIAKPINGLNYFNVFYHQGLIHLRARHEAHHWNWSTSAMTTTNGVLSGTSVPSGNKAAHVITTGGHYTFYAQAVDYNGGPVGDTYVASIEITPASFVDDSGCPEDPVFDLERRIGSPATANIKARPKHSLDTSVDTKPIIDVISLTFARPYRLTDGLVNVDLSNASVHVIIWAYDITWWSYWVDGDTNNITHVHNSPQATFLMPRTSSTTELHVLNVCGYDRYGTKVAENVRTFEFRPEPMPNMLDPTYPVSLSLSQPVDQRDRDWAAATSASHAPIVTRAWDDRSLGNFEVSVADARLGWINWPRFNKTETATNSGSTASTSSPTPYVSSSSGTGGSDSGY